MGPQGDRERGQWGLQALEALHRKVAGPDEAGPATRDLAGCGRGPSRDQKSMEIPSVKLDVAPPIPSLSRYQAWKFQVSPAAAETNPVG